MDLFLRAQVGDRSGHPALVVRTRRPDTPMREESGSGESVSWSAVGVRRTSLVNDVVILAEYSNPNPVLTKQRVTSGNERDSKSVQTPAV